VSGVPPNRGAPGQSSSARGHGRHHEFGRLRRTARQALAASGRSRAQRTGPGSGRRLVTCSAGVGITHADLDRSWPSFLVIPAPDETVDRVARVPWPSSPLETTPCCGFSRSHRNGEAKASATSCWKMPMAQGARRGSLAPVPCYRRGARPGGEKLGFDVIDRKDVTSGHRPPATNTRWRDRRPRCGCAKNFDMGTWEGSLRPSAPHLPPHPPRFARPSPTPPAMVRGEQSSAGSPRDQSLLADDQSGAMLLARMKKRALSDDLLGSDYVVN